MYAFTQGERERHTHPQKTSKLVPKIEPDSKRSQPRASQPCNPSRGSNYNQRKRHPECMVSWSSWVRRYLQPCLSRVKDSSQAKQVTGGFRSGGGGAIKWVLDKHPTIWTSNGNLKAMQHLLVHTLFSYSTWWLSGAACQHSSPRTSAGS